MPNTDSLRLTVAAEVRAAMARRNCTQTELAAALGLSQPSVSVRLTGQQPWTVDELATVARHLGTSLADLVADAA